MPRHRGLTKSGRGTQERVYQSAQGTKNKAKALSPLERRVLVQGSMRRCTERTSAPSEDRQPDHNSQLQVLRTSVSPEETHLQHVPRRADRTKVTLPEAAAR